ncbi:MAG: hypothetical protein WHS87_12085 [Anaerolineales bacterium]
MKGSIYFDGKRWHVSFYTPTGKIHKRFRDQESAEIFRAGLALKYHEGQLDTRDYRKDQPLSFTRQSEKWLHTKRNRKAVKKYAQRIRFAQDAWGHRNVKEIKFADVEDLLADLEDRGLSSYYRKHIRDTLKMFFHWLADREGLQPPKIPVVAHSIAYRNLIDKDTQERVLAEVHRLTWKDNPRIYVAIRFLATYINVRPSELCAIKEKNVDLGMGRILLETTKTGEPKWIFLTSEDVDLLRSLPRGFGELHLFRHTKGNGGAKPGAAFGKDYLYRWWRKACSNLGVSGVSLYPGTRHSSAVALRKEHTPEEIKRASMHSTNKAFERYLQVQGDELRAIYSATRPGAEVVQFPGLSEKT